MNENDEFLELAELFKKDPVAFEERRKQIINQRMIELCEGSIEKLEKARSVQWRLEQELSKYKDPTARYNKMVELFFAQVNKFQESLSQVEEIKDIIEGRDEKLKTVLPEADILEFKKKE